MLLKYFPTYSGKVFPQSKQQYWDLFKYTIQLQFIIFLLVNAYPMWQQNPGGIVVFVISAIIGILLMTAMVYPFICVIVLLIDRMFN